MLNTSDPLWKAASAAKKVCPRRDRGGSCLDTSGASDRHCCRSTYMIHVDATTVHGRLQPKVPGDVMWRETIKEEEHLTAAARCPFHQFRLDAECQRNARGLKAVHSSFRRCRTERTAPRHTSAISAIEFFLFFCRWPESRRLNSCCARFFQLTFHGLQDKKSSILNSQRVLELCRKRPLLYHAFSHVAGSLFAGCLSRSRVGLASSTILVFVSAWKSLSLKTQDSRRSSSQMMFTRLAILSLGAWSDVKRLTQPVEARRN